MQYLHFLPYSCERLLKQNTAKDREPRDSPRQIALSGHQALRLAHRIDRRFLECGLELLQFAFAEPALNIDSRSRQKRRFRAVVGDDRSAAPCGLKMDTCELSPRFLIFLFFLRRDDHLAFKRPVARRATRTISELRVIARPKD